MGVIMSTKLYELEQELLEISKITDDLQLAIDLQDAELAKAIKKIYTVKFNHLFTTFEDFSKEYFLERRQ
jgi:hypothetical protein